MSKWKSVKHFTWLGLSPQPEKTGGKVIHTKTKKTNNRANLAFRQQQWHRWCTAKCAGNFTAACEPYLERKQLWRRHKLARIVYHMLKYQNPTPQFP